MLQTEPAARQIFARSRLQFGGRADISVLLVHAPAPERQPAEAAFQHADAQARVAVEDAAADEGGEKAHRAPWMRGEPAKKDVVPQIAMPGVIGRVPGRAVVHDRQVVLGGCAPDRIEIGVVGRDLVDRRLDRHRPTGLAPLADFRDRGADITRRGDDRPLQPVRKAAAKLRHMAVKGADHAGFERRVVDPDEAAPAARHQEMHVGPLVVHVRDSVRGIVVLNARTRQLAAAPSGLAPAVSLARQCLAQHATISLRGDAVAVQAVAGMLGRNADRRPVGCEFGKPRAERGIDAPLQHLRRRQHMRVGIVDAESVLHAPAPSPAVRTARRRPPPTGSAASPSRQTGSSTAGPSPAASTRPG